MALLRDRHEVDALERDRDQRREGVEQAALLGDHQHARAGRFHHQHAAHAHRRLERQVQERARGQRVGADAGRLGMVEDPLRDRQVDRARRRAVDRRLQLVVLDPGSRIAVAARKLDSTSGRRSRPPARSTSAPDSAARHLVEAARALLAMRATRTW